MTRLALALIATIVLAALLALAVTDPEPALPPLAAPTAADVATTRDLVNAVRRVTDGAVPDREVRIPVTAIGSAVRLGARFLPGLRAEARIGPAGVEAAAAVPVPLPGGARWLNLGATIPPFAEGFRASALRLGPVDLPPGPSVGLARWLANLLLGRNAGDTILQSAEAMRIEDQTLVFRLRLSPEGGSAVAQGLFATLRGADMPAPGEIEQSYAAIRRAMDAGALPSEGSLLPHLRFALDLARAGATEDSRADAYTVAIFGLAKACGGSGFSQVVGRIAGSTGWDEDRWTTTCDRITLGGRGDLKQHFVVAAAIKAASNRGFAISVGEFKELADSAAGGSGFDFTDIAANNAGIRLSDRLMAAPLADWPDLVARITDEAAVLPDLAGLPGRMTEAEFAERFGSVESPAYADAMAGIEARIDALPLHRPIR